MSGAGVRRLTAGGSVRVTRHRGVLAGASATRWILAREDANLGRLQVHFPKAGYRLTPAEGQRQDQTPPG